MKMIACMFKGFWDIVPGVDEKKLEVARNKATAEIKDAENKIKKWRCDATWELKSVLSHALMQVTDEVIEVKFTIAT